MKNSEIVFINRQYNSSLGTTCSFLFRQLLIIHMIIFCMFWYFQCPLMMPTPTQSCHFL